MLTKYISKTATGLSEKEIRLILDIWEIQEWITMSADTFRGKFQHSEFHFLVDEAGKILCIARINLEFTIYQQSSEYVFAELVGLVAVEKKKGYGVLLVKYITADLRNRQIESIGFCEKQLRPFYEKCGITIFYGKAKHLFEKNGDQWLASSDDDILNLNLSGPNARLLQELSDTNPGYLE